AHKSSQRQIAQRIDDEEGGRKYKVQRGLLDTQRQRSDGLAQNDATLAEFEGQLAASRAAFDQLEHAAAGAFRGYRRFRRLLTSDRGPGPELAQDEYQLLQQLGELHARTTRDLARFKKRLLPQVFKFVPLWLWIVLMVAVGGLRVPVLEYFNIRAF